MKLCFPRKIFRALLAGAILFTTLAAGAAAEEPSITFTADRLVQLHPQGAENQNPNLFEGHMQNLMPGDQQQLTIQLNNRYSRSVVLYLRATETDLEQFADAEQKAASDDLLSHLTLQVTRRSDGAVLYDGSADGKTSHTQGGPVLDLGDGKTYISIGALSGGATGSLDVAVTMSTSLGNEYQNRLGKVDWILQAYYSQDSGDDGDDSSSGSEKKPGGGVTILDDPIPLGKLPGSVLVDIPDEPLPLSGARAPIAANLTALSTTALLLLSAGCIITGFLYLRRRGRQSS